MRRLIAAGATGLCAAGTLLGCATPVALPPPASPPLACAALDAELPTRVAGQDSRPTDPESTVTAAWGDPPISLRCGVPVPTAYRPTSQLLTINGVDWLPEPLTDGVRFTSIGRVANVEVTVPAAYRPEADIAVQLSGAVSRAIPPA